MKFPEYTIWCSGKPSSARLLRPDFTRMQNRWIDYPNMYPDYADVTIPVNIAPLNFEIRDKHLTNIETILTIEGTDANDADNTLTATSNSQNLKFDL